MIWFRRVIALMLALVFVALFIPLLVVFRVNSTAANPDFYINQLRSNDIYNFVYDDVLPAAIDEAFSDADSSDELVSLIKPRVVPLVEQALPRAWVQVQVEQVFSEILPYFLGDTRSFSIEIPLRERVIALSGAVDSLLNDQEFFSEFYDRGIDYLLEKNEANLRDVPFTSQQLKSAAGKALPPEWISAQLSNVIDEVTPYFAGEVDQFAVSLEITDRYDDLESALVDILVGQEVHEYVFDELLAPAVKQYVSNITDLPVDTVLTVSDIIGATRAVFTMQWYQQQVDIVVGQVITYLKGDALNLSLSLDLSDRKPVLISELGDLVTRKTGKDVSALVLPVITNYINSWIPDRLALDEVLYQVSDDIDIEEEIGKARDEINKGFSYTDADLRSDLKDNYQTIEDAREKISTGYVFTEQDFHDRLSDTEIKDIDNASSVIGKIRRWMWAVWIIPALLLIGIGALGDRKWTNKLIWGASVLGAASFIMIILSWPVFSALARPEINQALTEAAGQNSGLEKLVIDKAVSLSQNAIDAVVSGLLIQSIIMLVISLAVIGFAVYWNIYRAGAGPSEQPPAPAS